MALLALLKVRAVHLAQNVMPNMMNWQERLPAPAVDWHILQANVADQQWS